MQIAVFSARPYDRRFLDEANQRDAPGNGFAFVYFDVALDVHTAALAQDCHRRPDPQCCPKGS